jgi:hypothetical protein
MTATQPGANAQLVDELARRGGELLAFTSALADALGALTHEFEPAEYYPTRCDVCTKIRAAPAHRTPGRVRAELETGQ